MWKASLLSTPVVLLIAKVGGGGPIMTCRNLMETEYFNNDFTTVSFLSPQSMASVWKIPPGPFQDWLWGENGNKQTKFTQTLSWSSVILTKLPLNKKGSTSPPLLFFTCSHPWILQRLQSRWFALVR